MSPVPPTHRMTLFGGRDWRRAGHFPLCSCHLCSGRSSLVAEMVEDMLATAARIGLPDTNAYNAEQFGEMVAGFSVLEANTDFTEIVTDILALLERARTRDAAAAILAIRSVMPPGSADTAEDAAARLFGTGVTPPLWAAELGFPLSGESFQLFYDTAGTRAVLFGTFRRVRQRQGALLVADPTRCGAAVGVELTAPAGLLAFQTHRLPALTADLRVVELAAEEFRWQAEHALTMRDDHVRQDQEFTLSAAGRLGKPRTDREHKLRDAAYRLHHHWLKALPAPGKTQEPHPEHETPDGETLRDSTAQVTAVTTAGAADSGAAPRRPAPRAKKPASSQSRRTTPPVPIYQLRVELLGVRPPIWRRLEVPSDFHLGQFHDILQVAFDWDDTHLHEFDTSSGKYGNDPDRRPEKEATLRQVLPERRDSLVYLYDFGDLWRHSVVLERAVVAAPGTRYPCCTDGGRAAPPEDSGGVWEYQVLTTILADPRHPGYREQRRLLDLRRGQDFDPERFDRARINDRLST